MFITASVFLSTLGGLCSDRATVSGTNQTSCFYLISTALLVLSSLWTKYTVGHSRTVTLFSSEKPPEGCCKITTQNLKCQKELSLVFHRRCPSSSNLFRFHGQNFHMQPMKGGLMPSCCSFRSWAGSTKMPRGHLLVVCFGRVQLGDTLGQSQCMLGETVPQLALTPLVAPLRPC